MIIFPFNIFNQTQITGIQLKILEVSFECYKKRKISSEDFEAFINFVKKNCDTNNLVRYANMMYLSGYTSSIYLHESNEFIDFINRNLGGISFSQAFGES
ncbi:MAG: hypothetical protein KatS3mg085_755 [Candidatus Dojkabacteria bacterium]|nr:MAG: hypothetical protein KatS3mg085_755 [Candidatus Dojkabacteria bacterium]